MAKKPEPAEGALIISPAEPRWLKDRLEQMFPAVHYMQLPERRGVDVCWRALGCWWGVQRKQIDDLVSSLKDGRLQREVAQMTADNGVSMPHLIVEGQIRFTSEGVLIRDGWGQDFTRRQWRGLMWSLQQAGISITYATTQRETVEIIADLYAWSQKERHGSLRSRPGPEVGEWGTRGSRAWQRHLLQGFDGIGPEIADAIVEHFGGVPLQWTADVVEMLAVKGLGPKRVETLLRALDGEDRPQLVKPPREK